MDGGGGGLHLDEHWKNLQLQPARQMLQDSQRIAHLVGRHEQHTPAQRLQAACG